MKRKRISKPIAKADKTVRRGRGFAAFRSRNGVPVLPSRGEVVTIEHIRKLMDQEKI